MDGIDLFASAFLILLLLPVVIATWEHKRAPEGLYLAIAAGGIGYGGLSHGLAGALLAAAIGLACLLLVAAAVGMVRARWQVRLLVGSHIKLLGAGATWLSASGAIAMIFFAFCLFIRVFCFCAPAKRPIFGPNSHLLLHSLYCLCKFSMPC